MLFRCSQHDSAVARNLLFVLLLPLFLFLSFPLSVSASSLSFDSEMVKMVERGRERACETNEQQPLRGSCYPRSIGVYSTGVPLPTRFYLPDIYICIYVYSIFSPVFRLCFSPYDERNATNDLLPVYISRPTEEERIFICTHGRAPP